MKPIIGLLLVSVLVGHSYGVLPPMNYMNGDGMGVVHRTYRLFGWIAVSKRRGANHTFMD